MGAHTFGQLIVCICLAVVVLLPAKPVQAQGPDFIEIPLESLNNDQLIALQGLNSSQSLTIPIPKRWRPGDQNWLDFQIKASPLLDATRSSLTISLNNQPILSYNMAQITQTRQHIRIPGNGLTPGSNSLTLMGTLYLPQDSETNCQNWDDPSRWLTIEPGGILHLSFVRQDLQADLANVPELFFEPLEKYLPESARRPALFVLPENSTSDDLSSLSTLSYLLGRHTNTSADWRPEIVTQPQFNTALAANRDIVFIGNAPAEFQDKSGTDKDYVAVFSSPWGGGNSVLIIGDANRQDGYSPAEVFGDRTRSVLLRGNLAFVDHPAPAPRQPFPASLSFEDLGYLDRTVRGIGQHNLIYSLYIPYELQPLLVKLNLGLVHSPDLDMQKSSFTVYLNGFDVAGIRPSSGNSSGAQITVGLPAKRFKPGINFLRISFDLHLPYSSCERTLDSVWSTILNNSTVEITYRSQAPIPSLKHFPLPFSGELRSVLVLPDRYDQSDLGRVSRLAFLLGAAAYEPGYPPDTMTATDFEEKKTLYPNAIVIGLPSENPVIRKANELLPQPFQPGNNSLRDGYGVYLPTPDKEASLGLMQILASPWSKSGTLLVLTGNDMQGLQWTWDVILNPALRKDFAGNLMVAGSGARSVASGDFVSSKNPLAQFQQVADASKIPIIGPILQRNSAAYPGTALAAVVTALVFVIGILWGTSVVRKRNLSDSVSEEEQEEP
jgi:hypothetical protein